MLLNYFQHDVIRSGDILQVTNKPAMHQASASRLKPVEEGELPLYAKKSAEEKSGEEGYLAESTQMMESEGEHPLGLQKEGLMQEFELSA
uniref:Uncharacterized protein n=1 Tax=Sphaerodactylus townsendi TaxID=933632 RepID=A0ACB8FVM9_9SAUR